MECWLRLPKQSQQLAICREIIPLIAITVDSGNLEDGCTVYTVCTLYSTCTVYLSLSEENSRLSGLGLSLGLTT